MIRAALGALLLLLGMYEPAQAQSWIQFATCGTPPRTLTPGSAATIGADLNGNLCISGTISTTVTFPTIGAAVPATGIYNGVNVAGTLRGWSGLSTGSLFPGAVAIVDASGNQITSFGGSSATFGAAFPATGTAIGFSDGTNLAAPRVGAVANVAAATGFVDSLGVCQYLASAPTLTDTRFNQVQCDVNGYMRVTVQNTNANGQAAMSASSPVVLASDQAVADPCTFRAKSSVAISQTTSTVLVSASASNRIYVCSLALIAGGAEFIALTQGTGSVCGTSADAIIGSTTVGSGLSLAANGGLTLGNGSGTVARGPNTNEDVCLLQDGSDRIAGVMTYVLAP